MVRMSVQILIVSYEQGQMIKLFGQKYQNHQCIGAISVNVELN